MQHDTDRHPIRVFIGHDESQLVAMKVLEYTLRQHCSMPLEIASLDRHPLPVPREKVNRQRTGFSFQRFLIPELCGYSGHAIYLDADMLVFGDIAEIWRLPFDGAKVLCAVQDQAPLAWRYHPDFKPGRQMSVLLLDCAALDWDIERIVRRLDEGSLDYASLMYDLGLLSPSEVAGTIPSYWNDLERYAPERTRLIHYTVTPMQPWKNDRNPLRHIWEAAYRAAVADGAIDVSDVRYGVRRGHLKSSLLSAFGVGPSERWGSAARGSIAGLSRRLLRRLR